MMEWHEQPARALGTAIGEGEIDPVDLAEHFIARIEAQDTEHKIYIRRLFERTRAEAEAPGSQSRVASALGATHTARVLALWPKSSNTSHWYAICSSGEASLLGASSRRRMEKNSINSCVPPNRIGRWIGC